MTNSFYFFISFFLVFFNQLSKFIFFSQTFFFQKKKGGAGAFIRDLRVFERLIMKQQLCNFIEINNIYSSTQAGYRRNHSTYTILIKMRADILNAMNKGEVKLSVLADFSKAFDTVDYTVLIKKLSKLNMSPEFLYLILSYTSDRSQYV